MNYAWTFLERSIDSANQINLWAQGGATHTSKLPLFPFNFENLRSHSVVLIVLLLLWLNLMLQYLWKMQISKDWTSPRYCKEKKTKIFLSSPYYRPQLLWVLPLSSVLSLSSVLPFYPPPPRHLLKSLWKGCLVQFYIFYWRFIIISFI